MFRRSRGHCAACTALAWGQKLRNQFRCTYRVLKNTVATGGPTRSSVAALVLRSKDFIFTVRAIPVAERRLFGMSMPIFGAHKKAGSERGAKKPPEASPRGGGRGAEKKAATPPLPPPPSDNNHRSASAGKTSVPLRRELFFHCQLAHGSPTKEIRDFSNVKELYSRIAEAFQVPVDQVMELVGQVFVTVTHTHTHTHHVTHIHTHTPCHTR